MPTASGLAGTLPYMAPEQLHDQGVDSRSDLFSLGAVLYEMSAGRRAFGGGSPREILDAVCAHIPLPPSRLVPGLPRELDGPILKALEKSPEQRYQTAREMRGELLRLRHDLRPRPERRRPWLRLLTGARPPRLTLLETVTPRWLVGGPTAETPARGLASVAVVPVRALSSEAEGDLLADATTDALVARLSQNEGVRVVSSTSVMGYKGKTTPTPEIARDLMADRLVEGCLLLAGDRLRITVRVVDAATDRCVWSGMREGERGEALALQDELAQEVAREIDVTPTVALARDRPTPAWPAPRAGA
jgi:TolB-like protein